MVIASGGAGSLLPPVSEFVITRDVTDQAVSQAADLGPSETRSVTRTSNPAGGAMGMDAHYAGVSPRPGLGGKTASLTARTWPSIDAYTDTLVNSSFRSSLRQVAAVTTRDSSRRVPVRRRYPEMFLRRRVSHAHSAGRTPAQVPREQWRSRAFGRAPVGDDRTASSRGRPARASSWPRTRRSSWAAPTCAA